MNKQELIEAIGELPNELGWISIGSRVISIKDRLLELVNQLDEPKKVVVPKFVAEWFSKNPVNYWWQKIAQWEQVIPLEDKEVHAWYLDYNETTFIQAWIAYPNVEIEQKLYMVEIPDPDKPNGKKTNLVKFKGKVFLSSTMSAAPLTEAEIRRNHAWAWQAGFAKEVE